MSIMSISIAMSNGPVRATPELCLISENNKSLSFSANYKIKFLMAENIEFYAVCGPKNGKTLVFQGVSPLVSITKHPFCGPFRNGFVPFSLRGPWKGWPAYHLMAVSSNGCDHLVAASPPQKWKKVVALRTDKFEKVVALRTAATAFHPQNL